MKKLLLKLLELTAKKGSYRTGTKAPISGLFRSGKQIIPLAKSERFPPCESDWWVLVVAV